MYYAYSAESSVFLSASPLPHTLVSTFVMHYSVLYLLLMVVISTA